jgi:hypothetical protein
MSNRTFTRTADTQENFPQSCSKLVVQPQRAVTPSRRGDYVFARPTDSALSTPLTVCDGGQDCFYCVCPETD